MKKTLILILLISINFYGQEYNFDIQNLKLSDEIKKAENSGAIRIQNESIYYSGKGIAQPIRYKKREKSIPDCIINFKFYEKDSILKEIEYEWDVYNFEKEDNNKKSKKFQKKLIKKYQNLKKIVSKKFGEPKVENNYSNLADYKQDFFFEESSVWHPNKNTVISIHTTVSNYYEKKGFITINPTNRIRFSIINITNDY